MDEQHVKSTEEQRINDAVKKAVKSERKSGLYIFSTLAGIMIGVGMLSSYDSQRIINSQKTKIDSMTAAHSIIPEYKNVLGGPALEKFYVTGHDTAFVNVSGERVQDYFRK